MTTIHLTGMCEQRNPGSDGAFRGRAPEKPPDVSVRSCHLSDVRHFIAWYKHQMDTESYIFTPQVITTPALTRYRAYLQTTQQQQPASVNLSLKRYFGWALQHQIIHYDPSAPVKLLGQEDVAPRHVDDQEEQRLVAAVTKDRMAEAVPLHRLAQIMGTIRWTLHDCTFRGRDTICSKPLRRFLGPEP